MSKVFSRLCSLSLSRRTLARVMAAVFFVSLIPLIVILLQGVLGYTQYFLALPIALVTVHLLLAAVLTAALTYAVLATRRR